MRLRYALLASCCLSAPALAQPVMMVPPLSTVPSAASATAAPTTTNAATPPEMSGTTTAQPSAVPRTMPPAVDPVSPDKPMSAKEQAGVSLAQSWISKFQKPRMDGAGVEHFLTGRGQVFVVAAVNHITDIALAPGEVIVPPLHIGDAEDWKMHPAQSGSGNDAKEHILVKPSDAGLSTNLVIETNKRTVSIELSSRRDNYMPLVALDLPDTGDGDRITATVLARQQRAAFAASPCDRAPIVPPSQFRITGDNVPWRPSQAYVVATPVGNKTCVDFSGGIISGELPAMLALADDGGWFRSPTKKIVNVHFVQHRFVADEQLSHFILVDGVGGSQKSVTITQVRP
jgi:type IV secretion system protein TrbG